MSFTQFHENTERRSSWVHRENSKLLESVKSKQRDYWKCRVVWSSIKRDIVCCGLVSSSFIFRYQSCSINCAVFEAHTIRPPSVTPWLKDFIPTQQSHKQHFRHRLLTDVEHWTALTDKVSSFMRNTLQNHYWERLWRFILRMTIHNRRMGFLLRCKQSRKVVSSIGLYSSYWGISVQALFILNWRRKR